MFGSLMPREGKFFELFNQHAERIAEGSRELAGLMTNYGDLQARQRGIDSIDTIEKAADKITHETVSLLHKTFITPIDREDIHALSSKLDDILDLIDAAAHRLLGYRIEAVNLMRLAKALPAE